MNVVSSHSSKVQAYSDLFVCVLLIRVYFLFIIAYEQPKYKFLVCLFLTLNRHWWLLYLSTVQNHYHLTELQFTNFYAHSANKHNKRGPQPTENAFHPIFHIFNVHFLTSVTMVKKHIMKSNINVISTFQLIGNITLAADLPKLKQTTLYLYHISLLPIALSLLFN